MKKNPSSVDFESQVTLMWKQWDCNSQCLHQWFISTWETIWGMLSQKQQHHVTACVHFSWTITLDIFFLVAETSRYT